MTTPSDIVTALVALMRSALTLTPKTCYPIAAAAYIEGQDQLVVQVIPGNISPSSSGRGDQEGGALEREMQVQITVWLRLKLDMHGRSELAMMNATTNLMATIESIRALFEYSYARGTLTEPVWYGGESNTDAFDEDGGVYRRDIYFGCKWGQHLSTTLTTS